jgi:hypothetical protein
MTTLNEAQKDAVKKWLRSIGAIGDGFKCYSCGAGRFMEPSEIVTLSNSTNIQLVPLTCNTCAQVTFLDAQRIGMSVS